MAKYIGGCAGVDFVKKYGIYTSDDATTWTGRSSPFDYAGDSERCYALATDGTVIVAVGVAHAATAASHIARSTDGGLSWTGVTSPFDNTSGTAQGEVRGVWYSAARSLFMAVGKAVGATVKVCTSPDGVTWTAVTAPSLRVSPSPPSVTYQNGYWWVGGAGGSFNGSVNILYKSNDDGSTWTAVSTQWFASSGSTYGLRYDNSLYVHLGSKCFSCSPNYALETSPDGTTWTLRTSALTSSGDGQSRDAAYSSSLGLWAAVGGNGIVTSPDGATWTQQSSVGKTGLVWNADDAKFVTVGGTHVYTSTDGTTWTDQGVVTTGESFQAVIYKPPPHISKAGAISSSGALSVVPVKLLSASGATSPAGTLTNTVIHPGGTPKGVPGFIYGG